MWHSLLGLALIAASLSERRVQPIRLMRSKGTHVAEVLDAAGWDPAGRDALGGPDAPVTLIEYADLQCPYCAQWARGAFPRLVRDYVRTGKLRIEFRGLAFIGRDSDKALRAALAAGRQNRLWNVVELLYADQGPENSGWASEELIDHIASSVTGLDVERFDADRRLEALDTELAKSQGQAEAAGVRGTPTFELGPTGSAPETLELTSLADDEFAAAIEALLDR